MIYLHKEGREVMPMEEENIKRLDNLKNRPLRIFVLTPFFIIVYLIRFLTFVFIIISKLPKAIFVAFKIIYKKLVNEVYSIINIFRFVWEYGDYEKKDSMECNTETTKTTEVIDK